MITEVCGRIKLPWDKVGSKERDLGYVLRKADNREEKSGESRQCRNT